MVQKKLHKPKGAFLVKYVLVYNHPPPPKSTENLTKVDPQTNEEFLESLQFSIGGGGGIHR